MTPSSPAGLPSAPGPNGPAAAPPKAAPPKAAPAIPAYILEQRARDEARRQRQWWRRVIGMLKARKPTTSAWLKIGLCLPVLSIALLFLGWVTRMILELPLWVPFTAIALLPSAAVQVAVFVKAFRLRHDEAVAEDFWRTAWFWEIANGIVIGTLLIIQPLRDRMLQTAFLGKYALALIVLGILLGVGRIVVSRRRGIMSPASRLAIIFVLVAGLGFAVAFALGISMAAGTGQSQKAQPPAVAAPSQGASTTQVPTGKPTTEADRNFTVTYAHACGATAFVGTIRNANSETHRYSLAQGMGSPQEFILGPKATNPINILAQAKSTTTRFVIKDLDAGNRVVAGPEERNCM